jgi:hypothetical protein
MPTTGSSACSPAIRVTTRERDDAVGYCCCRGGSEWTASRGEGPANGTHRRSNAASLVGQLNIGVGRLTNRGVPLRPQQEIPSPAPLPLDRVAGLPRSSTSPTQGSSVSASARRQGQALRVLASLAALTAAHLATEQGPLDTERSWPLIRQSVSSVARQRLRLLLPEKARGLLPGKRRSLKMPDAGPWGFGGRTRRALNRRASCVNLS